LREEISEKLDRCNDISNTAERAVRDLTADEKTETRKLFAEVDELRSDLELATRHENELAIRRGATLAGFAGGGMPSDGPDAGTFDVSGRARSTNGNGPRRLVDVHGREVLSFAAKDRLSDHYRAKADLSIGKLIVAAATGNWKHAPAEYKAAMSESSNVGGGFMVGEELASQIIDLARARSAYVAAGAQTIPMSSDTLRIARVAADPTFEIKAENAAFTGSDITFGKIEFTARLLGTVITMSREIAEDAPNAASLVESTLSKSLGAELDSLCITGNGGADQGDCAMLGNLA